MSNSGEQLPLKMDHFDVGKWLTSISLGSYVQVFNGKYFFLITTLFFLFQIDLQICQPQCMPRCVLIVQFQSIHFLPICFT